MASGRCSLALATLVLVCASAQTQTISTQTVPVVTTTNPVSSVVTTGCASPPCIDVSTRSSAPNVDLAPSCLDPPCKLPHILVKKIESSPVGCSKPPCAPSCANPPCYKTTQTVNSLTECTTPPCQSDDIGVIAKIKVTHKPVPVVHKVIQYPVHVVQKVVQYPATTTTTVPVVQASSVGCSQPPCVSSCATPPCYQKVQTVSSLTECATPPCQQQTAGTTTTTTTSSPLLATAAAAAATTTTTTTTGGVLQPQRILVSSPPALTTTVVTSSEQPATATATACLARTCFDGIRNGDEEGVDCGGSCRFRCGACHSACVINGTNYGGITPDHFFRGREKTAAQLKLELEKVEEAEARLTALAAKIKERLDAVKSAQKQPAPDDFTVGTAAEIHARAQQLAGSIMAGAREECVRLRAAAAQKHAQERQELGKVLAETAALRATAMARVQAKRAREEASKKLNAARAEARQAVEAARKEAAAAVATAHAQVADARAAVKALNP